MTPSPRRSRDLVSLPKAELHLHLEGSMRRSTLIDLCQKYNLDVPIDTRGLQFDNFDAFKDAYVTACSCLREESDLRRLVLEVAQDAAASGAVWIEPAPSLTFYADRFGGVESTLRLLCKAAESAEEKTAVGIGYIISAERCFDTGQAERLAANVRNAANDEAMRICGRQGIVGFGLHGPEAGFPPNPFANAFSIACEGTGIKAVPHAGEIAPFPGQGAKSVKDAVTLLNADRIAHGVLAADDEETLQLIVNKNICLDICVSSNQLLKVVPDVPSHPLARLLGAGVKCTINSDDSLLFGSDLISEYLICRDDLGLSDEMLAECAKTSFQYCCAPPLLTKHAIARVEKWLHQEE